MLLISDCPVITCQHKGHGPEIEYLINDNTGFIIESHSIEAISEMVAKYLENKDIQYQMKLNIRQMIEITCSVDNFIKGFRGCNKFCTKRKIIIVNAKNQIKKISIV